MSVLRSRPERLEDRNILCARTRIARRMWCFARLSGQTLKPVTLVAGLAGVLLVAGCGAPHLEIVQTAKRELVGRDVAVLSRCIGEPLAVQEREGVVPPAATHLYSSAQVRDVDGRLLATPAPESAANARACVFAFTAQDGRIVEARSENRAGWGFGSIKNCSSVVKRCMRD